MTYCHLDSRGKPSASTSAKNSERGNNNNNYNKLHTNR